jgi:hypothetical protein
MSDAQDYRMRPASRKRALAVKALRDQGLGWPDVARRQKMTVAAARNLIQRLRREEAEQRIDALREQVEATAIVTPPACRQPVRRNGVWGKYCHGNALRCVCGIVKPREAS